MNETSRKRSPPADLLAQSQNTPQKRAKPASLFTSARFIPHTPELPESSSNVGVETIIDSSAGVNSGNSSVGGTANSTFEPNFQYSPLSNSNATLSPDGKPMLEFISPPMTLFDDQDDEIDQIIRDAKRQRMNSSQQSQFHQPKLFQTAASVRDAMIPSQSNHSAVTNEVSRSSLQPSSLFSKASAISNQSQLHTPNEFHYQTATLDAPKPSIDLLPPSLNVSFPIEQFSSSNIEEDEFESFLHQLKANKSKSKNQAPFSTPVKKSTAPTILPQAFRPFIPPRAIPSSNITPSVPIHYIDEEANELLDTLTGLIADQPQGVELSPHKMADGHSEQPQSTPPINITESTNAAEILNGIEFDMTDFTMRSPPSKNKFYKSSNSPILPATPSPKISRSSRGSVKSSPFSLTGNAMGTTSPQRSNSYSSKPTTNSATYTRSSTPFTSPARVESNSVPTTSPIRRPRQTQLFNLNPSQETLRQRKPLSQIGRGDRTPLHLSWDQLAAYRMRPDVIGMTADTAKDFTFQRHSEGNVTEIGLKELYMLLLSEGASDKLLKMDWLQNHYRLIVWKLCSMERSFPHDFANLYLTPERLLAQLKYRYEREINMAQRPPLRKILEHDAAASRHMVLVVTSVKNAIPLIDGSSPDSSAIIEVSDGWYCVQALCDPYLTHYVQSGRIRPGQKLHIFGSKIIGNDNPTPPLEVTSSTMLRLQVNGVRRSKWHTTLGFQRIGLPTFHISSLKPGGGICPKVDVVVLRIYPIRYTERLQPLSSGDDSSKSGETRISRSTMGEDRAMEHHCRKMEQWYESKADELLDEITSGSQRKLSEQESLDLPTQDTLSSKIRDVAETQEWMIREVSSSISFLVCDFPDEKTLEVLHLVKERGIESIKNFSISQLKVLSSIGKAIVTIFNTTEDFIDQLQEGSRIQISCLNVRGTATENSAQPVDYWNYSPEGHSKIRPSRLLRMNSTTYTRVQFSSGDKAAQFVHGLVSRKATPLAQLSHHKKLSDLPLPLSTFDTHRIQALETSRFRDRFLLLEEFDTAAILVSCGQRLVIQNSTLCVQEEIQQDWFFASSSSVLMVLRIRTIRDNFPNNFGIGSVLFLKNVLYQGYDDNTEVHSTLFTESTQVSSKMTTLPGMAELKAQLESWISSEGFIDDIHMICAKCVDVQTSKMSLMKPNLNPDNVQYKK